VRGAIGAIVLVDVRRLQDSFAAIDFFEARKLPFLVAVNEFDGAGYTGAPSVRKALALGDHVPLISVDARDRQSCTSALIAITEYSLNSLSALPG
jgi:signal recognition particle receptor subunit beta